MQFANHFRDSGLCLKCSNENKFRAHAIPLRYIQDYICAYFILNSTRKQTVTRTSSSPAILLLSTTFISPILNSSPDMNLLAITFGVMCIILAIIVAVEDGKQARLLEDKGRAVGKMERLERELTDMKAAYTPDAFLSADDIKQAVSVAGYVPDPLEGWIRFRVRDANFFVDIRRLPLVMVTHTFCFKASDWNPDRLREAGRKVTDEMIMLKVDIEEEEDGEHLFSGRIFIAAMDRNFSSFRDNLKVYVNLLDDGMRRMAELYDRQQEKDDKTAAVESFLAQKAENQVIS